MRCRKVRSFLSAYCSNEMTGRKLLALREHLSACSSCRKEENLYRSISEAKTELPELSVSDDFNERLLNRIAQERFSETRSKAYMPTKAPLFGWRQLAPAFSVVTVVGLLAFMILSQPAVNRHQELASSGQNVEAWMLAQPDKNPNVTASLDKNWSLNKQLHKSAQYTKISNSITNQSGFNGMHMASSMRQPFTAFTGRSPVIVRYHRVLPVIRVYQSARTTRSMGDDTVY